MGPALKKVEKINKFEYKDKSMPRPTTLDLRGRQSVRATFDFQKPVLMQSVSYQPSWGLNKKNENFELNKRNVVACNGYGQRSS